MNFSALHSQMLEWYAREKRDLPWRKSRDPYRIWISEIMLQQTRVETVLPYFERFLSNFPTVKDLAEAETDTLLNLWAGLGYYSRARNLKAAAQMVMTDFGGTFPRSFAELVSLKGIGPYTAAAIASMAFGASVAAIDGNLERVFSRLLGLEKDPKREGRDSIEAFGSELVAFGEAGDLNQAFMDFSSKVCLAKEPRCEQCPVQSFCAAHSLGKQKEIPLKKMNLAPIELRAEGLLILAEGEILLARRPAGEWLAGMWDLPWWIAEGTKRVGIPGATEEASCTQKRTITKHKIAFEMRSLHCERKPAAKELAKLPAPAAEFRWVPLSEMHGVNLPRPSERALAKLLPKLQQLAELS